MTLEEIKRRTAARKVAGIAIGMPNADRPFCGKAGTVRQPRPTQIPACSLRGDPTGAKALCPSCKGKRVELTVFACQIHGTCTIARKADGVKGCCQGCPDRQP